MAYSFRRAAIHHAREAYWLWSRRGIKVPGFTGGGFTDETDTCYVCETTIVQPLHGTQTWVVYLKANGALQGAHNIEEV